MISARVATIGWFIVCACSNQLPRPEYVQQPTAALTEVLFPPPPPRVETIPPQPDDRAVWLDGEWSWRGRRWAWKVGRWVIAPEGARYSPWTITRNDSGVLYFASGAWRNARNEDVDEPKAIAVAEASGGAVVDPEGIAEKTGPNARPDSSGRRRGATPPRADGGT